MGNWLDDKKNGYGILKLKDGTIEYEGDWLKGIKHGKGDNKYPNGDK